MRTKVKDIMTAEVVTVGEDTAFKEVAGTLLSNRVSAVPVVDRDAHVVGIVSEADLMRKEEFQDEYKQPWKVRLRHRLSPEGAHPAGKAEALTAADLMTAPVRTVGPEAPVAAAARQMDEFGVKRLVVTAADGSLCGVVSRADLLKVFVRSDAELVEEVRHDVLGRYLWVDTSDVRVSAEQGVVTLGGAIGRHSDAEIAARLTRRVDGVVDVVNELEWQQDDLRTRHARTA
ncbi:CBS domain-containing protein [Herbidospora daliensis]|uniref:CBS domain-containing protein n=1 Tax=Herbidospora daliensis TaxID=295585 RepID=UPI0007867988|nr:CBS domain-containing protein [Herbidospora daliensis]